MAVEDYFDDLPYFDIEFPLLNDEKIKDRTRLILSKLRPDWQNNITFTIFSSGITNKVICANGPFSKEKNCQERVILRIFGKNTEKIIDRAQEINSWTTLSKNGCAAPLYGRFSNGVICGFLEGQPLNISTIRDPHIAKRIGESLARIHKIKFSGYDSCKKPCLFKKMKNFISNIPSLEVDVENQQRITRFLIANVISFEKDVNLLKKFIRKLDVPIVFCHNDLLAYNILYDINQDRANFIDYEYADYNYQLFDIANHFCEYAGVENMDYSLCPSKEQKRTWIKNYLRSYLEREPCDDEIIQLLDGIDIFEAAAHLFWSLWGFVQSQWSLIDFDYLEYASIRYKMFRKIMDKINKL